MELECDGRRHSVHPCLSLVEEPRRQSGDSRNRKASEASAEPPKTIKTDNGGRQQGDSQCVPRCQHVQAEGLTAELNQPVERLQGTFRQRTKTLLGLDTGRAGRLSCGWTLVGSASTRDCGTGHPRRPRISRLTNGKMWLSMPRHTSEQRLRSS